MTHIKNIKITKHDLIHKPILILSAIVLIFTSFLNIKFNSVSASEIPVTINNSFGIAGGGGWVWMEPTKLARSMDGLQDLGVGWLRVDMVWNSIQPYRPDHYDWTAYDNIVKMANSRGIKVLFILNQTPTWARSSACVNTERCMPSDPNAFAKFASYAVERYAPQGVHAWEVWNEPNKYGFWRPYSDPVAYTTLLKATYSAIKAKDETSTVLFGGLGSITPGQADTDPVQFLKAVYANGGENYFDALSDHPYSYPVTPSFPAMWNAWQQMANTGPDGLRGVMVANGDSAKKIWITEFGAPTGGQGVASDVGNYNFAAKPTFVTETMQNAILADTVHLRGSQPWYGPLFWYAYQDKGTSMTSRENFFGLLRYDGTKKPSYDTFKYIVKGSDT